MASREANSRPARGATVKRGPKGPRLSPDDEADLQEQSRQDPNHDQPQLDLPPLRARGTRVTDKHIIFLNGPLSNWNVGEPFSGARAMDLLIPWLDDDETLGPLSHPSRTALSTRLMHRHEFLCGEQFMMAAKGWLFERDNVIPHAELDTSEMSEQEVAEICDRVLESDQAAPSSTDNKKPASSTGNSKSKRSAPSAAGSQMTDRSRNHATNTDGTGGNLDLKALNAGTLVSCLLTTSPRTQKLIGRQVRAYDEAVWTRASPHVVVAGSIARAEADPELREVYVGAGSRKFVEGSPVDKVWGIGIKWDEPRADDETRWRGKNRLGKCHDRAARLFRSSSPSFEDEGPTQESEGVQSDQG